MHSRFQGYNKNRKQIKVQNLTITTKVVLLAKTDPQPLQDFYKNENYSKNYEIFTQLTRHIYLFTVKISAPYELI